MEGQGRSELQNITHRRTRGFILKCLSLYPTEFINLELIADFVRTCGISATNGEVQEQVMYLEMKGYIKVVKKGDPQISRNEIIIAEIDVKGIDLIEGNIEKDPGIALPK